MPNRSFWGSLALSILTMQGCSTVEREKPNIASSADLPSYNYSLQYPPSELIQGPLDLVLVLADEVTSNDASTLAAFQIDDLATRESILQHKLNSATLRGNTEIVRDTAKEMRAIQEREDRKLTAGLLSEIVAEACGSDAPGEIATALADSRLSSLPYASVDAWMKEQWSVYSTINPDFTIGLIKERIDPIALKGGGQVDHATAAGIVSARVMVDCIAEVAPQISSVMERIIGENQNAGSVDIWADRNVTLPSELEATPVTIAVWDAGVDLSLFKTSADPGLAIDGEGNPSPDLLRPVGDYADQIPELQSLLKGLFDLRAGLLTPDAKRFQDKNTSMAPEEAAEYLEALSFMSYYVHGTHVAGIAVEGNPFASVQAISMHFPEKEQDYRLNREISERRSYFYQNAVERMREAGVRVVNMSWGISPEYFEQILAVQGGIPDAAERRRVAAELFDIEKTALEEAIRSEPNILFVAAAGNSANDANFAEFIPSSLSLPNLITVGAVDRAGREAMFTSFGDTVSIYANGVDVESVIPGGEKLAFSGTSMASPQVANAAAKIIALHPELNGAEVRDVLIDSSDEVGRIRLLNLKAALSSLGVLLEQ